MPADPPPPAGDDRRNLANLLAQVRRTWITNVLDRSVSHAGLLDPRVRMEPGAVEPPWRRYVEAAEGPGELLAPDRTIGQVFDDAGRMLLVLGEPGAGKTTTLLSLTRECIQQAERDASAPVPVVLNLSSWTESRPFHDWLVVELATGYNVGEPYAQRWLRDHRLLLLLDGLDEVAADRRGACVQALHAFVQAHGVPGLAVCCRSTEYRALPVRLKLGGAVLLLPLDPAQIDAYLDAAGPALEGLRDALTRSAELRGLAESPLMLSIMTLALGGLSADELRFDETAPREELREEIFGRFVDRMFDLRARTRDRFSRGRVEDGLRWLARGMRDHGSVFAVELLQPAWLSRRQLLLYTLASRTGGALVVSAVFGAVCLGTLRLISIRDAAAGHASSASTALTTLGAALTMGLLAGLFYAPVSYHTLRRSPHPRRVPGVVKDLAVFLAYLALAGLAALLTVGIVRWGLGLSMREPPLLTAFVTVSTSALFLPLIFLMKAGRGYADRDIGLAGTLSWRWSAAAEQVKVCAVASVFVVVLAPWLGIPRPLGLVLCGMGVFAFATYAGWRQEVPPVERWRAGGGNSALRDSGRVFAAAAVVCLLALFPLLLFAVDTQLTPGDLFVTALLLTVYMFSPAIFWFGGIDVVLHAALRVVLSVTRTMPLRLRGFLDYAVRLGFLQHVGGGYTFFHRLLLEHFAARPAFAGHPAPEPAEPTPPHHAAGRDDSVDGGSMVLHLSVTHRHAGDDARAPEPEAAARILFLSANSPWRPLDLELELRHIEDHLLRGRMRDRIALKAVPAVTVDALMRTMMEEAPTHVHFSGHGRTKGIVLRDELGDPRVVRGAALAELFRVCGTQVRCVVLNACYSERQARAIRAHVPYVVGSTARIQDVSALSFSSGFYLAIAAGKDVPYAFEAGKVRTGMDNVPGQEHLVLL